MLSWQSPGGALTTCELGNFPLRGNFLTERGFYRARRWRVVRGLPRQRDGRSFCGIKRTAVIESELAKIRRLPQSRSARQLPHGRSQERGPLFLASLFEGEQVLSCFSGLPQKSRQRVLWEEERQAHKVMRRLAATRWGFDHLRTWKFPIVGKFRAPAQMRSRCVGR